MWKNRKMGDLSNLERGQIICAHLAWASMTKTATLLGISRATVSKVLLAYMNHGKTTAKRSSGWKSALTERDRCTWRRIVSKNHRTTGAQVTAELNIHLEDPVSTKTVWCELHKSVVGLQLLNLWLWKVMLRCINDGVTTIKREHWATGNVRDMVIWVILHSVPYIRKSLFGEHHKKPTIRNAWFQQWNMGEVLWCFGQQYRDILLVPLLPFMAKLLQENMWTGEVIRFIPWSDDIFEQRCSFRRKQCPQSHIWNCSFMVWRAWRWTSASPLASTITRCEHHWTTLVSFGD
jgi:hypothetical protein